MIKKNEMISIRRALPVDVNQAALLLQQALASVGDNMFGNGDQEKSLFVLKKLFLAKENRFNYRYSYIAEKRNLIVGLLLAFRSDKLPRLNLLTGLRLLGVLHADEFLRLVLSVIRIPAIKETGKDEFYISDLAVSPEFRGLGIGTALLDFAEELAGKLGLRKCSLVVTSENEKARNLYIRKGYKVSGFMQNHRNIHRNNGMDHYRMVKEF